MTGVHSPTLFMLSVWHVYGFWVAACVYVTTCANQLLAWYIDWYRGYQESALSGAIMSFPVGPFLTVFMRSWILVSLIGELVRCCYLLAQDAWRPEPFETYREALTGRLFKKMQHDIAKEFRRRQGGRRQETEDLDEETDEVPVLWKETLLQGVIFASFDVLPLVVLLVVWLTQSSLTIAWKAAFRTMAFAALGHSFFYFLVWTLTDVAYKVIGCIAANKIKSLQSPPEQPAPAHAQQPNQELRTWLQQPSQQQGTMARSPSWSPQSEGGDAQWGERMRTLTPSTRSTALVELVNGVRNWWVDFREQWRESIQQEEAMLEDHLRRLMQPVQSRPSSPRRASTAQDGQDLSEGFLSSASAAEQGEGHSTSISCCAVGAGTESQALGVSLCCPQAQGDSICVPYVQLLRNLARASLLVGLALLCGGILFVRVLDPDSEVANSFNLYFLGLIGAVTVGAYIATYCKGYELVDAHARKQGQEQARCCVTKSSTEEESSNPTCRALQVWGEYHCGLDKGHQRESRMIFGSIMLLQALLFASFAEQQGTTGYWVACGFLGLLLLRDLIPHFCEGNYGWLIGLIEGFCVHFGTAVLGCIWQDASGYLSVLLTLLMSTLRQFGLGRYNPRGNGVARFTMLFLNALLALLVGIVVLVVADNPSGGSADSPSGPSFPVPHTSHTQESRILCSNRFPYGSRNDTLGLSDFALFSALVYEDEGKLERGLQQYFPGWGIQYQRRASRRNPDATDWTTFFEFFDPENTTTVFAVRGTSTPLDVLDDLNIFTPAAIIQAMSLAGPSMSAAVADVVFIKGMHAKEYFQALASHVDERLRSEPKRRFYLTGHSLGGGLAKLVASQRNIEAVTFMAPGLSMTSTIVYGKHNSTVAQENLRQTSLTVVPANDVVSRVDYHGGAVVNVPCDDHFWNCHLIHPTICTIMELCGSGREGGLWLPCDGCPKSILATRWPSCPATETKRPGNKGG